MEILVITETIRQNLLTAAKWLKFLTVLGTIGVVFLVVCAIAIMFVPSFRFFNGAVVGIAYLFAACLYIYPLMKCYAIVEHTNKAMNFGLQASLEESAVNVKSLLKFFGIVSIVVLSVYALLLVIAIFGFIFSGL